MEPIIKPDEMIKGAMALAEKENVWLVEELFKGLEAIGVTVKLEQADPACYGGEFTQILSMTDKFGNSYQAGLIKRIVVKGDDAACKQR